MFRSFLFHPAANSKSKSTAVFYFLNLAIRAFLFISNFDFKSNVRDTCRFMVVVSTVFLSRILFINHRVLIR